MNYITNDAITLDVIYSLLEDNKKFKIVGEWLESFGNSGTNETVLGLISYNGNKVELKRHCEGLGFLEKQADINIFIFWFNVYFTPTKNTYLILN